MTWITNINPDDCSLFQSMQENRKIAKIKELKKIMPMANDDDIARFLRI